MALHRKSYRVWSTVKSPACYKPPWKNLVLYVALQRFWIVLHYTEEPRKAARFYTGKSRKLNHPNDANRFQCRPERKKKENSFSWQGASLLWAVCFGTGQTVNQPCSIAVPSNTLCNSMSFALLKTGESVAIATQCLGLANWQSCDTDN